MKAVADNHNTTDPQPITGKAQERPEMFVDIDYSQSHKYGENICGDAFTFLKKPAENRLLAVLSDGLGSGIKANILASMTATMALKFAATDSDMIRSAEIMMSALPICQTRKISYATFTIIDAKLWGRTKAIEMGNPQLLLIRDNQAVELDSVLLESEKWKNRSIRVYDFEILPHDRLIVLSDGITQAGMGTERYRLGWRREGCAEYITEVLKEDQDMSSHQLTAAILREAKSKEPMRVAADDMTCAAIHFRPPRKLLLFTGPPFNKDYDRRCAMMVRDYEGRKVICGGTTAGIVSRELNRPATMDISGFRSDLPPTSFMQGVDLITEGIFTLTRTAQYLEEGTVPQRKNAATQLVDILRQNDIVEFLVGTRINEVCQDPNLPVDLEIRRNIIKRLAHVLQTKYSKEVTIKFV